MGEFVRDLCGKKEEEEVDVIHETVYSSGESDEGEEVSKERKALGIFEQLEDEFD